MLSLRSSAGLLARPIRVRDPERHGLGDDIERGDARHHAEELADIAERVPADCQHGARVGGSEIHPGTRVTDENLAILGAVIAVEAAHQRGFADAGGTREHHALSGAKLERDAVEDRNPEAALQVKGEGFLEAACPQQHLARRRCVARRSAVHGWITELTRSCV
jgi:hypothetical protein